MFSLAAVKVDIHSAFAECSYTEIHFVDFIPLEHMAN